MLDFVTYLYRYHYWLRYDGHERATLRAAWQSKSKSSDTIPGGIGTTAIYTIYTSAAQRFCCGTPFFCSASARISRRERASDRERETDTKVAECIEAKRTHVSTPCFIVCTPPGIRLFFRPRLGGFQSEGTKKSWRDFFRKMNSLLPFTPLCLLRQWKLF